MNILYATSGVPLLQTEDGLVYEFTMSNLQLLVGELSVDINACQEIKQKVAEVIEQTIGSQTITADSSAPQANSYISSLSDLSRFYIVNDIVAESINNYKMMTTPKPHERWIWSSELSDWIAPINYPEGAEEGIYIWSDNANSWEPAEPKPHLSWVWDEDLNKYVPPIPYPLDAQEGEFVWDESKLTWVLNV
jgi:hypothetical protein